jgi:hypothetical protein
MCWTSFSADKYGSSQVLHQNRTPVERPILNASPPFHRALERRCSSALLQGQVLVSDLDLNAVALVLEGGTQ